jgi:hypothetical protein
VFCPEIARLSFFNAWTTDGTCSIHNEMTGPRIAHGPRLLGDKSMRLPSAPWALLGLAAVLLLGYGLNRGILVGSRIEAAQLSDAYPVPFYKKHCRYLFFTGVQQVWTSSESTRKEAEQSSCAPLKSEPILHRRRKLSNSQR